MTDSMVQMNASSRSNYRWAAALMLAALVVAVIVHDSEPELTQRISFDQEGYESIDELQLASDAVIVGRVGAVVGERLDLGGGPAPVDKDGREIGIPLVLNEVEVIEVLGGSMPDEKRIIVASLDDRDGTVLSGEWSALTEGDQVVLFLAGQDGESAPSLKGIGEFFVTVSGDNGVGTVGANGVVSLSPTVLAAAASDAEKIAQQQASGQLDGAGKFEIELSNLRDRVG